MFVMIVRTLRTACRLHEPGLQRCPRFILAGRRATATVAGHQDSLPSARRWPYRHRRGVGANADGNRLTGGGQVIGCIQIPVRLHRQHGQGVYLAAPPPTLRIPFIRRRPLLSLACPCLVDEVIVSRPGRPAEATRDAIRRAARSAPAPVGLPERVVSPTARSSATCVGVGASFSARRSGGAARHQRWRCADVRLGVRVDPAIAVIGGALPSLPAVDDARPGCRSGRSRSGQRGGAGQPRTAIFDPLTAIKGSYRREIGLAPRTAN